MLKTNNNPIKNSIGVNKKLFSLLFIGPLFLLLLALFGVHIVKAFNKDDIAQISIGHRFSCGAGGSENSNWYGVPSLWSRQTPKSTFFNGCIEVVGHTITSPGGCKVFGCGTDESLKCETLEYSRLFTYTDSAYDPLLFYNRKEFCLKCNAEVEEVVEEGIGTSGKWITVYDTYKYKNKCAMYKDKKCANPCPETCPAQKCEEFDGNGDGDIIDETDYRCVLATAAAPTAAAPIAYGSQTAAAAGEKPIGVVLAASTNASSDPGCKCLVDSKNFTWCPVNTQDKCCPPNWSCKPDGVKKAKNAICCSPDEELKNNVKNYCSRLKCESTPKTPQFCSGSLYNACCKPSPENTCGEFTVKVGWPIAIPMGTVAYCKTDSACTKGKPGYCAEGVCCLLGQACKEKNGLQWCQPKDETQCNTASGETFCPGEGEFSGGNEDERNLCCPSGQSCLHMPNGYPYCLAI